MQYDGIDLRLLSVTTMDGQITTQLRIYNGQSEAVTFTQDDTVDSVDGLPSLVVVHAGLDHVATITVEVLDRINAIHDPAHIHNPSARLSIRPTTSALGIPSTDSVEMMDYFLHKDKICITSVL